jgi:hypothetical protein
MTIENPAVPRPFTSDDFAARMSRVVSSAAEEGLAGVIVTPGPVDLAPWIPSDSDH